MNSIYSYLDNIEVTVFPDNVDLWFAQNKCDHVGFDTESKPLYNSDESHILAIIQIGTPTSILICRVFDLPVNKWPISLVNFLEDINISKYCVDTRQDEKLLTDLGINVKSLVELQTKERKGMKKLANTILGLNLDKSKSIQAGDWSKCPLTIKQIEYAATDALVCLALAEKLQLAPKKLVQTIPINILTPKGDKPEVIINLLIACIKYRKKELKLEPDNEGLVLLTSVINLVDFKRLYTSFDEIKSIISNDKKRRLILLDDKYKLF